MVAGQWYSHHNKIFRFRRWNVLGMSMIADYLYGSNIMVEATINKPAYWNDTTEISEEQVLQYGKDWGFNKPQTNKLKALLYGTSYPIF